MVSSIYESQERCRSSFEGLIDILKNPARDYGDQIPPKGVANEFSRFKVWAGSLGARQNPQRRISLDYRLRDSTYYRDRVVEFLDDLHASLQKGESLNAVLLNIVSLVICTLERGRTSHVCWLSILR